MGGCCCCGGASEAAASRPVPALSVGVRLHDLPEGTVWERISMAGELGFTCLQLPSKVLFASLGIDRTGLTPELAERLRTVLDEAGVEVAVLGCYKNLATPDAAQLAENLAEYEACLRFAKLLGGCPVGTETGRPNAGNAIAEDRFSDEALDAFCQNLARVCEMAEDEGVPMLIEPGWNEVVCTPGRCRAVLDRVDSPALGVIYDAVSLLHPSVAGEAQDVVHRMLELNGDAIRVLHAKDFSIAENEDAPEWCDGTGKRLVCHGPATTGNFDMAPVAEWAAKMRPGIFCVMENSTPETMVASRAALIAMG